MPWKLSPRDSHSIKLPKLISFQTYLQRSKQHLWSWKYIWLKKWNSWFLDFLKCYVDPTLLKICLFLNSWPFIKPEEEVANRVRIKAIMIGNCDIILRNWYDFLSLQAKIVMVGNRHYLLFLSFLTILKI